LPSMTSSGDSTFWYPIVPTHKKPVKLSHRLIWKESMGTLPLVPMLVFAIVHPWLSLVCATGQQIVCPIERVRGLFATISSKMIDLRAVITSLRCSIHPARGFCSRTGTSLGAMLGLTMQRLIGLRSSSSPSWLDSIWISRSLSACERRWRTTGKTFRSAFSSASAWPSSPKW
jgi:hypothetical protein